ncbi:hypothetical protein NEOLI_002157 [Neolecta irregularis DAH-3]|uniref:TELO2-interacting protein 2 n=1 Tax=Neolecta irregularis (strain DAH-3) TaxID=1198029 RepID=A0A1U7LS56_NEOID|nr:hypothetical protein NEOLI_002157 [Neolecta irregularis DAH-3]|eukprot:OLL25506.1 hypothetical protein NEOLI_002157 [Neolecta irregularis DAH-3]
MPDEFDLIPSLLDQLQNGLSPLPSSKFLNQIIQKTVPLLKPLSSFGKDKLYQVVDHEPEKAFSARAEKILEFIQAVLEKYPLELQRDIKLDLFVALASYTRDKDPWTTPVSTKLANTILQNNNIENFVYTAILQDKLKPRFLKNSKITDHGRLHPYPRKSAPEYVYAQDRDIKYPWKAHAETITILEWTIRNLPTEEMVSQWPLIIPPVVTMLQDISVTFKIRGCEILLVVLKRVDPTIVQKSGLADLFWQSLMVCLTYLPTITPEDDSAELLDVALAGLFQIAAIRFPDDIQSRAKLLDQVYREGIERGVAFAGEYLKIICTLIRWLNELVQVTGIYHVKHLKNTLQILADQLQHPLAHHDLSNLTSSVQCLLTICTKCWPRLDYHHAKILKAISICFRNLSQQDSEQVSQIRQKLIEIARLLKTVCSNDLQSDIIALVQAEPQLESLLSR